MTKNLSVVGRVQHYRTHMRVLLVKPGTTQSLASVRRQSMWRAPITSTWRHAPPGTLPRQGDKYTNK